MNLVTRGSGLIVAGLAIAVASTIGISAARAQPYGQCTPAPGYSIDSGAARPDRSETVVPVILHMMMSDVPSQNPHWPRDPSLVWTPEKVQEFFSTEGRVNQIWSAAGIRVAVVRVDRCPYSPTAVRPDRVADVDVATPLEIGWGSFFGDIASAYNARDRAGLNVYVWVKVGIRKLASAYGTSPRHPPSAVWVDVFCALSDDPTTPNDEQKMDPQTCARKLAHEVGHALTLRHSCNAQGGDSVESDADLPPCAEDPGSRNLMHPKPANGMDLAYRKLTPDQTRDATTAAKLYPQP